MTKIDYLSIMIEMNKKKLVEMLIKKNFSQGSTTYSKSSLFFPKKTYEKISLFYSFVRIIDDLVDQNPVQEEAFFLFKEKFYKRIGKKQDVPSLIERIVCLIEENNIPVEYFDAFWDSMEFDLQEKFSLKTLDECKHYMYGSAEVIGLIICSFCMVDKEANRYAGLLGRSMQFANFIRDFHEDSLKGRQYIPLFDTELRSLSEIETRAQATEFVRFIRSLIDIYFEWLKEAYKGFAFLPAYLQIPILTATQGYHYIMLQIYEDPFKIYGAKVRPSTSYILLRGLQNVVKRDRSVFDLQGFSATRT